MTAQFKGLLLGITMTTTNINGAQALVRSLEMLGVKHVFGHPGGAAINIFDALLDSSINFVLTRHEQGATHMADGYARASGEIGVALVTSGPGALNTVTGLATAKMDSVPLIVISGQTNTTNLGKDAFQESDVFGVTMPLVKHSYLILDPKDIVRSVREAFHIASTGRPGPVLIDLPKDISSSAVNFDFSQPFETPKLIFAMGAVSNIMSCQSVPSPSSEKSGKGGVSPPAAWASFVITAYSVALSTGIFLVVSWKPPQVSRSNRRSELRDPDLVVIKITPLAARTP